MRHTTVLLPGEHVIVAEGLATLLPGPFDDKIGELPLELQAKL
jgi:hypothetical protein